ncbi:MAG TPA: PfkB family carbohydrate kinase [Streptosporangiaceae bacterium]|nr:PfkB family carbohydrate kinase [Streptosporangiaceae bacterium]
MTRLLHLGNVVVDLVLNVPYLPERGADVLAAASRVSPGGGFNVLAAAARQGLRAAYAGAHGSGPFADLARAGLAAEGIEVLLPPAPGRDTGVVIAIVEPAGERTFLTAPGAEAALTAAGLAAVEPAPGDVVYLSGYSFLHAANRAALLDWLGRLDGAGAPGRAGIVVVFDPGPLADQVPAAALAAVLGRADWLTCNAREATILSGQSDPLAATRALTIGQRGVVVRTGPGGCLLGHGGGEPVTVPGWAVQAVDTNGAGDTHAGVFIAALARGAAPPEAARLANAAAALSVTRAGPATAPTALELARWMSQSVERN